MKKLLILNNILHEKYPFLAEELKALPDVVGLNISLYHSLQTDLLPEETTEPLQVILIGVALRYQDVQNYIAARNITLVEIHDRPTDSDRNPRIIDLSRIRFHYYSDDINRIAKIIAGC